MAFMRNAHSASHSGSGADFTSGGKRTAFSSDKSAAAATARPGCGVLFRLV